MYWKIGKRIFEEEQAGKNRADYGTYLTKYIAEQLEPEYGSGFSKRQVELSRQFYRTFPIANTVYSELSWSQYKLLIRCESKDKRDFYMGLSKMILAIGGVNCPNFFMHIPIIKH